MPRTWVGWLNFLVLQWFFVRLARGSWTPPSYGDDYGHYQYSWITRVWPLTGWWNNYRMIK